MKKNKIYHFFILSLFLSVSCTKEMDFDNTDNIDINFGLNVPIMTAQLNLKSFIDSNENIQVDSDGGLEVFIQEDNIFDFSLNDFTSVPDQELFKEDILIGNVDFAFETEMNNVGDLSVSEFTFESGKFEFTAISPTPDPINIKIKINNGIQSGDTVVFEFTTSGLSTVASFDLEDLKMDFTGPKGVNFLDLEYSSSASMQHIGSTIELTCKALDATLQNVKGDFGSIEVDIPNDNFGFEIDGFEKFVDGLYFTNPQFNLNIQNELGFELGLDLELNGENSSGVQIDLDADQLIVSQPSAYGQSTDQVLSLNNTNSNLSDFLSKSPNSIDYGGKVQVNPGTGPFTNYLDKDFHCKGSLDIQIPLEIKVTDLVYETLMEDTELFSDEDDVIHGAELLFRVTNTFPLGANVEMILMNESKMEIDTIELPLLVASPVDNNGISTGATPHDFSVVFTDNNIQSLYDTQHIKFIGHLSSTDGGTKNVKITDSSNIEIKLAIKVNGSITSETE